MEHQLSQLNQLFGKERYREADAALRRFIPRYQPPPLGGMEARAAAIWALGLIHEGKTDPELATALEARLNDGGVNPEDARVRGMSAVTLARMKTKEALRSLRKWYASGEPSADLVNNACGWAIEQLTGQAMPPPRTIQKRQLDWFLNPDR
jgi:hypothetical protein